MYPFPYQNSHISKYINLHKRLYNTIETSSIIYYNIYYTIWRRQTSDAIVVQLGVFIAVQCKHTSTCRYVTLHGLESCP